MDHPDASRGQRPAGVRPATLVARVWTAGAVLDQPFAPRTVIAAAPQLGVERFDRLCIQSADLDVADERPDVPVDVAEIAMAGRPLDLEDVQPAIQKLVHGRLGPRVAALVHLGDQPDTSLLGLSLNLPTGVESLDMRSRSCAPAPTAVVMDTIFKINDSAQSRS